MEPVPEIPLGESRRTSVGQQQSPRHSLLYDDQGRPVVKLPGKCTPAGGGVETPIVPDANTLKRKLHNLFLSGPSLRTRQSESSLGSAASASPVSTGSPMEWPSSDPMTPVSSPATPFPQESYRSRDISLEEELQARAAHMSEAARTWQARWRQEREDTCRLTDHLARCETESKRLLESVSVAYSKKVKMLEETLMRAMKSNERLLLEKELLDSRLKQSKEVIDLQRHEIEKEFARARKDVELLRGEVGNMQSRTQRLEKENDALKAEKQLLTNDLKMFTGNTKKFSTTMKEADVRCELYRVLLDIALQKLKVTENNRKDLVEERVNVSRTNRGRYVLRVDAKDPTSMHVEDVYETMKAKAKTDDIEKKVKSQDEDEKTKYEMETKKDHLEEDTKATEVRCEVIAPIQKPNVIKHLEIKELPGPKMRYLPVVHMTTETYSQGLPEGGVNRAGKSERLNHDRSVDHNVDNSISSTTNEDKSRWNIKSRRFSFGKDNLKPRNIMKQLGVTGGNKADVSTVGVSASRQPGESVTQPPTKSGYFRHHDVPEHPHSMDDSLCVDFITGEVGEKSSARRTRSLSATEDVDILLDKTTAEYSDGTGNNFIDIQETSYRHRSNTMDGTTERPKKNTVVESIILNDSPTSSNEELRNSRTSGFEALRSRRNGFSGLSSSPETAAGKSLVMRKYKSKDITDLFKVFTSDKDGGSKDPTKGHNKKKGKFGK